MNEVWYKVKANGIENNITDYAKAMECKANGAEVTLFYKEVPSEKPVEYTAEYKAKLHKALAERVRKHKEGQI